MAFHGASCTMQVPQEKGYVWFTVEETIEARATSPSSIGKAAGDSVTNFLKCLVDAWGF